MPGLEGKFTPIRAIPAGVAQAAGGLMAMTGFPDGPPVRGGGALADFAGGLYLALGLTSALLERERSGRARVLDLSNQDAIFAIADSAATIMHGLAYFMVTLLHGLERANSDRGIATLCVSGGMGLTALVETV